MTEMNAPRCIKCGRSMERGLIIDRGHSNAGFSPTWLEGESESWTFLGLKVSGRIKRRGKEKHDVLTFRCTGCGYLESYAPASPDSPR